MANRLPAKLGDRQLDKPPAGVTVSLMGAAPSLSTKHHWSECIVIDKRPDPQDKQEWSPEEKQRRQQQET